MMRRRAISNKGVDRNNYMTIEALEDGVTVSFTRNVQYTKGKGWRILKSRIILTLSNNEFCSFKCNLSKGETIGYITIEGNCNLTGNCLSLIFGDDALYKTDISGYDLVFEDAFITCTGIKNVSSDFLPATTLANYCYRYMFSGCSSLTTAPKLPATNLTNGCYQGMFLHCTNLTIAPDLPAEELNDNCYSSMFSGSGVNYIKALFKTPPGYYFTSSWVENVPSVGTFVKNPEATWEIYGDSGIPNGWTVKFDGEEESGLQFPITLVEGDNGELGKQFYQYVKGGKYTNEEVYVIRNGYICNTYYWSTTTEEFIASFDWDVADATNGVGSPEFNYAIVNSDGHLEYL